jgi:hypothetical protein
VLDTFDVVTFAGLVGHTFRIADAGPAPVATELVDMTAGPERPVAPGGAVRRRPFSLVFRGPPGAALPQRTYRVEHDALGTFDLFLVPIGPDAEGMRYEAVFG